MGTSDLLVEWGEREKRFNRRLYPQRVLEPLQAVQLAAGLVIINRASLVERIWYESSVPIFGEKFVLPVLATIVTAVVVLNPMKWDWQSRLALFVGVTALAFLLSHQMHLRNEAIRTGTAPTSAIPAATTGPAIVNGACDGTNTGNGGKVDVNCK